MTLPSLAHLDQTLPGLHQGARLLGLVQQLTQAPQPAYLELALALDPRGLVTGSLPSGGRVRLDFPSVSLVYQSPGQPPASFPLNGSSQAAVFSQLFDHLTRGELASLPPGETLFERVAAGIAGRQGRYKPPQPAALMDESTIQIDPSTAQNLLRALQAIYTGIARFKAQLRGLQTPLVIWPHGFDLSTLWFVDTEIDEQQAHMNFGFSPGSLGIDYPYLYAYAYPYRDDIEPALPEGAHWHTEGWKGVVLPYQAAAAQLDPVRFVEESCVQIFIALAAHLEGANAFVSF